jgi:ring-1,2-phenylacetyl-CoA epoxidase subunit PaaE
MALFHPLKVADIRRETADCVSVAFLVPGELADTYKFTQGQYLTFKKDINGESIRRSYSICSSPMEGELRVAIKKVDGGRFSTFANEELKVGDVLETMKPTGRFYTALSPENKKHYVAFAAGSGITPMMSIMKTTLATEPNSHFTLFYGNRNFNSIIFREQIEDLKDRYLNRMSVYHILSGDALGSDLLMGRLDAEKCERFCTHLFDYKSVDHYFLCGPGSMIHEVKDKLVDMGVEPTRIHFELFTTPGQSAQHSAAPKEKKATGGGILCEVSIIMDGHTQQMELDSMGMPILDAALHKGLDVPYACKGAVCATCKAKVLEGEVEMEMNYSLEADELAAGYVLTCQAHPKTKKVVVDYDH